ncbi:hypothetical protein KFK09_016485 [Dendrobium nobile]|uniref:Uncharacterized protein n=1 Tax=Dendrobium nobile TaxID=94219 RepID=A0A8T3AZL4_DENNO|nr:hypothetical protein KFK09_016485 [Dendrobium nobile]
MKKRNSRVNGTLEISNIHGLLNGNGGLLLLKFQILEQEISIDELAKSREKHKEWRPHQKTWLGSRKAKEVLEERGDLVPSEALYQTGIFKDIKTEKSEEEKANKQAAAMKSKNHECTGNKYQEP